MPVKNVKRKTNDGFEGVITGLNDKEKEIIYNVGGDYSALENKPSINGVSLEGNQTAKSLFGVDISKSELRLKPTTESSYDSRLKATQKYIALDLFNWLYHRMLSLYSDKITFTYCKNWNEVNASQKMGFNLISQPSDYTPEYKDSYPYTIFKVIPDTTVDKDGVCVDNTRVEGNENNSLNYIPVAKDPSEDGTYTLKLTKSGDTITYVWVDTSVGTQYFEDINVGGVSLDDKISSAINSAITSTLEANY